MSDYLDTLVTLQDERTTVVNVLKLRKADPDHKLYLIEELGPKYIYHACQQYFAHGDADLSQHLKNIDHEIDELLNLISLSEFGGMPYLKPL